MALCLIDAHAHVYPGYDVALALRSAAVRFRQAASGLGAPAEAPGIMLLASGFGTSTLDWLRHGAAGAGSYGEWKISDHGPGAMLAESDVMAPLILIEGRQIRTENRLEVLALGSTRSFDEGQPLRRTVLKVLESGAVAVIPWGFGKWWGRRGQQVQDVLNEFAVEPVWLGDSAGRMSVLPEPQILRAARREGRVVLPGSDPLPVHGQERKLGRCGLALELDPFTADPASAVRNALRSLDRQPRVFGEYEKLVPFVYLQLRMQARRLKDSELKDGALP